MNVRVSGLNNPLKQWMEVHVFRQTEPVSLFVYTVAVWSALLAESPDIQPVESTLH